MRWRGAVAIITGGSRGIGRATALAAGRRGARVGLIARTRADLEAALAEAGGDGAVATADVTDPRQVDDAIASIEAALGPADILVNNAGAGAYGLFVETDSDTFERMIRVNYLSAVYTMKAVLPGMLERGHGHIVSISSIAGRVGAPLESAYSASKFALSGLSEAVAVEAAARGVGVSVVSPGPVETEFFERRGHAYTRRRPRPVPAEKVADAVIAAVERGQIERFIPRWLRQAVVVRTLAPPLYRTGTRRAFREDLR